MRLILTCAWTRQNLNIYPLNSTHIWNYNATKMYEEYWIRHFTVSPKRWRQPFEIHISSVEDVFSGYDSRLLFLKKQFHHRFLSFTFIEFLFSILPSVHCFIHKHRSTNLLMCTKIKFVQLCNSRVIQDFILKY